RGGEADEAGRRTERLPAGAAVDALAAHGHQERHYPLAHLPALDPLAELRDPPDDLDTEDEGQVDGKARDALADVDVEVVERAGRNVDQHFSGAGPGIGDAFELQDVQSAELVQLDRRPCRPLGLADGSSRGVALWLASEPL